MQEVDLRRKHPEWSESFAAKEERKVNKSKESSKGDKRDYSPGVRVETAEVMPHPQIVMNIN